MNSRIRTPLPGTLLRGMGSCCGINSASHSHRPVGRWPWMALHKISRKTCLVWLRHVPKHVIWDLTQGPNIELARHPGERACQVTRQAREIAAR